MKFKSLAWDSIPVKLPGKVFITAAKTTLAMRIKFRKHDESKNFKMFLAVLWKPKKNYKLGFL